MNRLKGKFRVPSLAGIDRRKIAMASPVVFVLIVLAMSAFSAVHARFDWVPVSHGNIVLDSTLKLVLAILLAAIAIGVVFPLSLALHMVGHAGAGHFFGMRLLAVRLGPVLVTPFAIGNRFEWLGMRTQQELLTGWVQFDDSPLPTWKRIRGWQVMTGGGPAMNLGVSFIFAMMSLFATGVTYVIFRQMVWINLAVCVVNLIPFVWTKYEYESDGKRLLGLFLDEGDGAEALMERMRNEVVVGPIRPASWPRERESAWEIKLRQLPATDEGRADQLETMIYLFLQGVDRGDHEVSWRWVQAMHHVIASDSVGTDVATDTARVMCGLYAARWEKNAESAGILLDQVGVESGLRFSPWYTVARAAQIYAESFAATFSAEERLTAAHEAAVLASEQLRGPARLHGVDQLMLGLAKAIEGDAEIELQKLEYHRTAPAASQSTGLPIVVAQSAVA